MGFFRRARFEEPAAPAPEPQITITPGPEKNAQLREMLEKLQADVNYVLSQCAPLEAQRQTAFEQAFEATARAKAIGEQISALKDAEYREKANMVAALTRALGNSRTLVARPQ